MQPVEPETAVGAVFNSGSRDLDKVEDVENRAQEIRTCLDLCQIHIQARIKLSV